LVLLLECRNDVCVSSIPLFVCIICGFSTAATWFVSTTCELALPEHRPMYGPSMAKQAAAAAMGNLCFRGEVDLYIFRIDNEVGVGVDDGVDVGVDVDVDVGVNVDADVELSLNGIILFLFVGVSAEYSLIAVRFGVGLM